MDRFWREFELFHDIKIPKVIKRIFELCAIDKSTFDVINEKLLNDIEVIVNKNKTVLKDSVYEKDKEFKFLFGHRVLLLSIPSRYKLFCDDKKEKKKLRKQRLLQLKVGSDSNIVSLKLEKLRSSLLERLNSYAKTHSIDYNISENQIKKFNIKGNEAYCVVQCSFCETKIPCTFNSSWSISNFTAHVRTCVEKSRASASTSAQPNQTRCQEASQSFQRAKSFVLIRVGGILKYDLINIALFNGHLCIK